MCLVVYVDLPTVRRPSIDYSVLSPATRPTYGVNNVSMQLQVRNSILANIF